MRCLVVVAIAVATPAVADTLADAIARHDAGDISRLRGKLADPSARCALGVVYLLNDDLTRAAIYLDHCSGAALAPAVTTWVDFAVHQLGARLAMGDYAPVQIETLPAGVPITIDTLANESFTGQPQIVWLRDGRHQLTARWKTIAVEIHPRTFASAAIDLRGTGETPWPDPGRAPHPEVMHANDCTVIRLRYPTHPCQLPQPDEEEFLDFDGGYSPYKLYVPRPMIHLRTEMIVEILASAEPL